MRLRDDATFANYYPGANAAALGYVERLCEAEAGWAESLIYLWGHDGVGRSHLLQAACLRFEQFEERTIYLPMADLVQYGPEIFDDLEQCELVCIDDLDVLVGKREWEEGLFHLFNRLRDTGRRLLLAASKSPRELQVKLPDLKSRLTMALIFQLHGLSDEDKLRALQLRASRRGLHLTDEVGRFILNRGSRSMNSLFDLLEQLDRASLQAQRKLTIPFLKETSAGRRRQSVDELPHGRAAVLGFRLRQEVTAFYPSLHPCAGNTGALAVRRLTGGRHWKAAQAGQEGSCLTISVPRRPFGRTGIASAYRAARRRTRSR